MNTCIIFSFEFCGKKYYGASIPVANIDTNQYEKIWTHWGEFKGGVQTTDGHKLNVWFDYELTAEKGFTLQDTIGLPKHLPKGRRFTDRDHTVERDTKI